MKTRTGILMAVVIMAVLTACADSKDRYIDLGTGEPVVLVKDEQTGLMVNAETKKPVRIYVDTRTNDTIWGKTGAVINGDLHKSTNGIYVYSNDDDSKAKSDEDGSSKVKDGDYKKKVDEDGDVKIKDGDKKIKIDAQTGEKKVKKD